MNKVLLIIPASVDSTIVENWINTINEKLDIIYVIDKEIPDEISSWMLYTGFLGEKPTEDVVKAVKEEMNIRGKERLEGLKERFKNVVETDIKTGDPEEIVGSLSERYQRIFLLRRKEIEEVK